MPCNTTYYMTILNQVIALLSTYLNIMGNFTKPLRNTSGLQQIFDLNSFHIQQAEPETKCMIELNIDKKHKQISVDCKHKRKSNLSRWCQVYFVWLDWVYTRLITQVGLCLCLAIGMHTYTVPRLYDKYSVTQYCSTC